jgi:hypothetical protein
VLLLTWHRVVTDALVVAANAVPESASKFGIFATMVDNDDGHHVNPVYADAE